MNWSRRSWTAATAIGVLVVLTCTLFPFTFTRGSIRSLRDLLSVGIGPEMGLDIATNVLLFLPFGFAAAGQLAKSRVPGWAALAAVLGGSVCLSYAVEVLQHFLPSRITSLSDVLANGAGGVLGFVCYRLWRGEHTRLDVAAYMVSASLASLPLQWSTTAREWAGYFPLVIGNELTGDRQWNGRVYNVEILDRALSASEVSQLPSGTAHAGKPGAVLASYDLTAPCPCGDRSGHLSPLIPKRPASGNAGTHHSDRPWLETRRPARSLVNRVKETSMFTLAVTAASVDADQRGPARIVSISFDTTHRNFTLGQEGDGLVFRLRTTLTSENGNNPELVVPGVFSTPMTRQLVITYDGMDLLAYIDGRRAPQGLRLGLGTPAFAQLFGRDPARFHAYYVAYYGLIFIPAGVLISRARATLRRPPIRIAALTATAIACALTFEWILVASSGRMVSSSNLAWAAAFTLAGAVLGELARSSTRPLPHTGS